MILNPLQIGPCTLDEAVDLMGSLEEARTLGILCPDSPEGAATVLSDRVAKLAQDRSLLEHIRHAIIKGTFENTPVPSIVNPSVCVHELFHAFIEKVLPEAVYAAHGHVPCLWEEAAADRALWTGPGSARISPQYYPR